MEKNIKKRVCGIALALCAVLVVMIGYWFFFSAKGYCQKQKEADKEEYLDRRLLWRKSEKMNVQQMLSDMTLLANGDSVLVCHLTTLPLSVFRDFIHGKAQPKRRTWVDVRYWYMTSLASGKEWMQERVKDRNCKGLVFYESSRYQVQKDSLKDYRKEKLTLREVHYNKVYPAFGKSSDKEFEIWRKEYKSNRLF